jgi:hypothetical protein
MKTVLAIAGLLLATASPVLADTLTYKASGMSWK